MKILYAIQGTGNGHISRAKEIIPLLRKKCETDILISGDQAELDLPFEVKYRFKGLGFVNGKNGSIDIRKTYKKANTKRLLEEIKELPAGDYDFVLNDFEPVSAWSCYRKKVPCIALSHQCSLLDKNTPRPRQKDPIGSFIIRNYAPASHHVGFHFSRYSKSIFTPVVRKEVREAVKSDDGHYTVYLPSYDDKFLIRLLSQIQGPQWEVFSKSSKKESIIDNINIKPVNSASFLKSLVSCTGVLCGAGFETPAESLFLGKKLLVVPMNNQYEQQYNATALKSLGVPVISRLKKTKPEKIVEWVNADYRIEINYPDVTERIINMIFERFVDGDFVKNKWKGNKFRFMPKKWNL
jgi:uncharacterized protein (TIGR00661 family)